MNTIGIKLADGSFYSILDDGKPSEKALVLTTAKDNQTRVLVDLYRSATDSMEDAEYVDSLQIDNLVEHPNGSANISLNIALDENGKLSATINDPETGASSSSNITLVTRTAEERRAPADYDIVEPQPEPAGPSAENAKAERTGGLLAAASAAASSSDEPDLPDFDSSDNADDDTTLTADELSGIAESAQSDDAKDSFDDVQLPDSDNDKNPAEDTTLSDTDAVQSSDSTIMESQSDIADSEDEPVLPDFDGSDNADDDTTLTADELSGIAESAQSDDAKDSLDDIQLPDSDNDKTPAADTTLPDTDAVQSSDSTITETQTDAASDEPVLPDFDGNDNTDDDTTLTADELSGIAESAQSNDTPDSFDDVQLPDFDNDKTPAADTTLPDTDAAQSSDETPTETQTDAASEDEPVLPDFDGSDNTDDDTTLTADELSGIAESAQADDAKDSFDDVQLPDSDNDKTPAEDTTLPDTDAAQSSDETLTETQLDAASEDLGLPDFDLPDIEAPVDTAKENPADFDLPDFSGFDTEETSLSASPLPDFDLPDFKEPETAESESPIDFDLPDFSDFDTQTADKTSDDADESPFPDFALPDFEETDNSAQQDAAAKTTDASAFDDFQTLATDNPFPDFDLPDFPEESFSEKGGDVSLSDSDFMDDLNTMTFDDEPSSPFAESGAGGINFDGLYDKETLEGHSAGDGDEIKKKTKLPVIICVICAVICIIATALILFVLPTNYNILSRARMQNEEPVQSLTQKDKTRGLEPEPVIPPVVEAKEEEIVVAPEPEQVVPEAPKEPIKKAGDTLYTIKWGDTLWDISDAYYKTPWEFQMIADYNNISDPDYIVSGTTIKLPPK